MKARLERIGRRFVWGGFDYSKGIVVNLVVARGLL